MTKRFMWEIFVGVGGAALMWWGVLTFHMFPYVLGFLVAMGTAIRLLTGTWFR